MFIEQSIFQVSDLMEYDRRFMPEEFPVFVLL